MKKFSYPLHPSENLVSRDIVAFMTSVASVRLYLRKPNIVRLVGPVAKNNTFTSENIYLGCLHSISDHKSKADNPFYCRSYEVNRSRWKTYVSSEALAASTSAIAACRV